MGSGFVECEGSRGEVERGHAEGVWMRGVGVEAGEGSTQNGGASVGNGGEASGPQMVGALSYPIGGMCWAERDWADFCRIRPRQNRRGNITWTKKIICMRSGSMDFGKRKSRLIK